MLRAVAVPDGRSGTCDEVGSGKRSSRNEFNTTKMLDPAMTAAAMIGCNMPSAASDKATRL